MAGPDDTEAVRLALYRSLAATGGVPPVGAVAEEVGLPPSAVEDAIEALAASRHVVLDADRRIVLAHPFATRSFGFSVMGERTLWWGGCAWDSFAIPHLVPDQPSALVATACPACRTPHAWVVDRSQPPAGSQVAHFLVPVARVWDDGRLGTPYRRREPREAAAYFASVGLRGEFWGT